MKEELDNKNNNELIKKFTIEEAQEIAIDSALGHFGIKGTIKELTEKQLPAYFAGDKKIENVNENITKVSRALSLDSGHALVESVDDLYQGFALQMKEDLEKEFQCKTTSEKALVYQAVNSFMRKLTYVARTVLVHPVKFLTTINFI
ncbi:MAG: hypothetical protein EOM84_00535 [Sphingobacteriia bacterium]|jgi:hypothetical protein|nr:hypothetical protein [Sphingobacteriia bacterium]